MNIIPIHNIPSKPVKSWLEIKRDAEALKELTLQVINKRSSLALHHAQVSEDPRNFFVLHPSVKKDGIFPHDIVINPAIDREATEDAGAVKQEIIEGCMSFTLKPFKKKLRYDLVVVTYQTKAFLGFLEDHSETLKGLAAQIFQHEVEHSKGRNMYQ